MELSMDSAWAFERRQQHSVARSGESPRRGSVLNVKRQRWRIRQQIQQEFSGEKRMCMSMLQHGPKLTFWSTMHLDLVGTITRDAFPDWACKLCCVIPERKRIGCWRAVPSLRKHDSRIACTDGSKKRGKPRRRLTREPLS